MSITRLGLTHFRNIKGADLATDGPFIVVGGDNGAGKTALLEGLHLLLAGRSFRTRESSKLVSQGRQELIVSARIEGHHLGTRRSVSEPAVYRLDGEAITIPLIAQRFPVQIFDNRLFDLFEGPPRLRRQLLDWGVFHVKQSFYPQWQGYQQALKQRNALLKDARNLSSEQLDAWDRELLHYGQALHVLRCEYAEQLAESCKSSPLLESMALEFSYAPGWNTREFPEFSAALEHARSRDLQYRRTTVGPHQADFRMLLRSRKAGDVLSRGQKKLAGFAIKLAQVRMYNAQSQTKCILLCDDFSAELDSQNQRLILDDLRNLGSQAFITLIDPRQVLNYFTDHSESVRLFHVKQGEVIPDGPSG